MVQNSFSLDLSIAVQDFESIADLKETTLSNGLTMVSNQQTICTVYKLPKQ